MKRTRDADSKRTRPLAIEFIGGPYDGHKEPCSADLDRLPTDVIWLVCEDAFRVLAGKVRRSHGSLTSVAFYELDASNGVPRYRFVEAMPVKEFTAFIRGGST